MLTHNSPFPSTSMVDCIQYIEFSASLSLKTDINEKVCNTNKYSCLCFKILHYLESNKNWTWEHTHLWLKCHFPPSRQESIAPDRLISVCLATANLGETYLLWLGTWTTTPSLQDMFYDIFYYVTKCFMVIVCHKMFYNTC